MKKILFLLTILVNAGIYAYSWDDSALNSGSTNEVPCNSGEFNYYWDSCSDCTAAECSNVAIKKGANPKLTYKGRCAGSCGSRHNQQCNCRNNTQGYCYVMLGTDKWKLLGYMSGSHCNNTLYNYSFSEPGQNRVCFKLMNDNLGSNPNLSSPNYDNNVICQQWAPENIDPCTIYGSSSCSPWKMSYRQRFNEEIKTHNLSCNYLIS